MKHAVTMTLMTPRKKYGCHIEAKSHTDLITDVHIAGSNLHLCVKIVYL